MQRRDELIGRYVACYVLYLTLVILSAIVFLVWRQTILLLIGVAVGPAESDEVLFAGSQVLIVFALFALVLIAEPYLREGVGRHKLRARFIRLAVIVGAAILVGIVLQEVLRTMPLGSGA